MLWRVQTKAGSFAPWLLAISAIASLVIDSAVDPGDLHCYILGGAALGHDLYGTASINPVSHELMPFVYPPFAAMVFWPLHLVPLWLAALGWRVGMIAALYASVRISQKMMGADNTRTAMLWTAGALWLEPVVGNLKIGNVGVYLMVIVLCAAYSRKWWVSGLLIGLGAGVKLTPAIAGVYLAGHRRWAAAIFSGVVFLGTIGVSYLVTPGQVSYYFTKWLHKDAPFAFGYAYNQSWRGGIARILGYDPGTSPLVGVCIAATGVLAIIAWGRLHGDPLGTLLVVMIFGLLASPLSWTNQWTWIVPLLIWLHGRGSKVLWWAWLLVGLCSVSYELARLQPSFTEISRPWYLAWAGLVYPVLSLATYGWIIAAKRKAGANPETRMARV